MRQSVVSLVLPRRVGNLDIGEEVPRRHLTWTAAVLSLFLGIGLAWSRRDWSGFLAARIGQRFGESDPYFAADLGFFVHRLPLELSLFTWTMTMVLIVIGLVTLLYALTPSLRWEQGGLYVSGYVRRHFAMLGGVLLLLLAWHYRLEMYTLLGEGSAADGTFTYLDHRVGIPADLLLSLVTLGAGVTVMWAGWTGQLRLAFAALTGVIIAVVAARQVAPFIARRAGSGAEREPSMRERPYEATRAGHTRRAFAVDRIQPADATVAFASLAEAAQHVPIWDAGALRRATERPLPGGGVGWLLSDSAIVALGSHVSRRGVGRVVHRHHDGGERNAGAIVAAGRRRRVPMVLIAADSAPRARMIADSAGHVAAPSLASAPSRLAQALSIQDFRIWLGTLPTPAPKLVTRLTVRERVGALAPFFAQGSTVTPLWHADTLVWALHLYSSSRTYPLSRRVIIAGEERAYFHHAATALVNATTGRTVLVADSLPDPIASTWMTRFPRLFERATKLPAALRRQLPPARDGARAQASAFGRVGLRDDSFVPRHLPDNEGPDSALAATPGPVTAFPRAGSIGYVLPLLDRSERIGALFIALGGPTPRSMWMPAGETAPMWNEALDRLRDADTVPASLLVRGYVRPIAVNGQIVLVQPRYDWRGNGPPRLLYTAALSADSVRVRAHTAPARRPTSRLGAARRRGFSRARESVVRRDAPRLHARRLGGLRPGVRRARRACCASGNRSMKSKEPIPRRRKSRTPVAIIALGGNALAPTASGPTSTISSGTRGRAWVRSWTWRSTDGTCASSTAMARRSATSWCATSSPADNAPPLPLGVLVAATAGWIGYMIQQSIENALRRLGSPKPVATIVTQVQVDPNDPALTEPTKFIGRELSEKRAAELAKEGHRVRKDGRGRLRRVVGSPRPLVDPRASDHQDAGRARASSSSPWAEEARRSTTTRAGGGRGSTPSSTRISRRRCSRGTSAPSCCSS